MAITKRLKRINELAAKAKKSELTADEKQEQQQLRKEYIASFRENLRQQIETTQLFDKKGKEITPDKVQRIQREKGWRKD
ncbi:MULTISPECIES: DUF896 domain-containing protein [Loigolactobacillus]|uniref:UPF0291 protein AYR53_08395 n=1 Tax=Loigolactobacillus backii TaxID=375175 RepID=A0A192H468_9LACO|nr:MULTISPECIES: DUF896 domain-containing protein [Loigolactobacillus]ANK59668.1 hypothetical protein AYR52_05010 [Loigolactobacillus backii]ANK62766.1 hypothetical protein AYR53_08395 [Loigolactobacillus backii]ANK64663.1 hypothetical protein AYR54_05025 [Loigolactobacillus backii]ANK66941.1 hypothetical protein AYR55_04015 [Loigolactobacillus backii]ANK70226.1 hypothetical protein AYR56_08610 [Loigolactobacillus backii]